MLKNGLFVAKDGTKRWYKDNKFHREDGPAVEHTSGNYWYQNGEQHREDGPAVEYVDGAKEWYYKGIFVGFGGHPDPTLWARLTSVEVNGGPLLNGCVVDLDGDKWWHVNDKLHRVDGPAIEYANGDTVWWLKDERLGEGVYGFWKLWDKLTDEQRGNPTLLKYMPR